MKITAIVQARMTSSRLPGKVLKKVLDKPLLEYQIERMRRIELVDEVVLATTTNATDDPVIELCNRLGISTYRGSENDVLARYYEAAKLYQADVVVRLTADCPILDPFICNQAIDYYLQNQDKYDYVRMEKFPRGLDTEVFPFEILAQCYYEAKEQPEREHVTPFIYRHPERYRVGYFISLIDYSVQRWTVDTEEDFELIKNIIQALYPTKVDFILEDVFKVMDEHPEWRLINAHVEQRKL